MKRKYFSIRCPENSSRELLITNALEFLRLAAENLGLGYMDIDPPDYATVIVAQGRFDTMSGILPSAMEFTFFNDGTAVASFNCYDNTLRPWTEVVGLMVDVITKEALLFKTGYSLHINFREVSLEELLPKPEPPTHPPLAVPCF